MPAIASTGIPTDVRDTYDSCTSASNPGSTIVTENGATNVMPGKPVLRPNLDRRPIRDLSPTVYQAAMDTLRRSNQHTAYDRSVDLVKDIDAILTGFRSGRLSLEGAISHLESTALLDGTGYMLDIQPSFSVIQGPATEENFGEWVKPMFKGSNCVIPGRDVWDEGAYLSVGMARVFKPQLDNGYGLFAEENRDVAMAYLRTLSEELYHASQHMRGWYSNQFQPQMFVSDYFNAPDPSRRPYREYYEVTLYFEADVYAKLIEVLGLENIPKRIGRRYDQRIELVDRSLFSGAGTESSGPRQPVDGF